MFARSHLQMSFGRSEERVHWVSGPDRARYVQRLRPFTWSIWFMVLGPLSLVRALLATAAHQAGGWRCMRYGLVLNVPADLCLMSLSSFAVGMSLFYICFQSK